MSFPNMSPQPRIQNAAEETANTMKFLDRMFTQFLARHMPDSTAAKPRFMKNTNMAVINTHTVSNMILRSALEGPAGAAGASSSPAAGVSAAEAPSVGVSE